MRFLLWRLGAYFLFCGGRARFFIFAVEAGRVFFLLWRPGAFFVFAAEAGRVFFFCCGGRARLFFLWRPGALFFCCSDLPRLFSCCGGRAPFCCCGGQARVHSLTCWSAPGAGRVNKKCRHGKKKHGRVCFLLWRFFLAGLLFWVAFAKSRNNKKTNTGSRVWGSGFRV